MISENTEEKIREAFRFYKGLLMDLSEQHFSSDPEQWQILRRQILRILSNERGLESQIFQLLKEDCK